jgi:chromate reductase, NAD(P)H dehydrogenase (quinone)
MPTVLIINGSLRAQSIHGRLLAAAETELDRLGVSSTNYAGLRTLPLYDQDLDVGDESPAEVLALRAAVVDHDAIIIAMPTYNYSLPGGLKNLLDWVSRPFAQGCISGRKVGLLGAAPGPAETTPSGDYLAKVLPSLGAKIIAPLTTIPKLYEAFDTDGVIAEQPKARVVELARAVALAAKGAELVDRSVSDAHGRFELRLGGENGSLAGFADYRIVDGSVELPHTVSDPAYSGQGIGSALVRAVLDSFVAEGKRVIPTCSFVSTFIDKNPDYKSLL